MMNQLVKKSIQQLTPYEAKELKGMIRLDANENTRASYLLNQKIGRALMEVPVNQYPDSDARELRKVLGKELMVSPEKIIVGCGSDQLISMILQAFIDPGDKILTQAPTFSMYKISNQIAGGETMEVPLEEGFKFNLSSFLRAIGENRPKIVFLTNPNNPTGGVIPREQIIKIIECTNGLVVVDEAYYEFYGESVVDLTGYYHNLMVLRTLSKAYGLAGARVGYGIASREVIDILNRVKPPYNVSSLDQQAALVCLENKAALEGMIEEILSERRRLEALMGEIEGIEVFESHGNFILIKLKKARGLYEHLFHNGLLVRYFGEQGPLAGCLRVTVGTEKENNTFLGLLDEYLNVTPMSEGAVG